MHIKTIPFISFKAPITTAADDIHFHCFLEKIRLDVSSGFT